jgi:hypothetical protein
VKRSRVHYALGVVASNGLALCQSGAQFKLVIDDKYRSGDDGIGDKNNKSYSVVISIVGNITKTKTSQNQHLYISSTETTHSNDQNSHLPCIRLN